MNGLRGTPNQVPSYIEAHDYLSILKIFKDKKTGYVA